MKHMRSHVGDKTYQCNQCPSAFRLYSELRLHIREHFAQGEIPSDDLVQKSTKGVNAIPDVDGQIPPTVRINDAQTFLVTPQQKAGGVELPELQMAKGGDHKSLINTIEHLVPVTIQNTLPPLTIKDTNGVLEAHPERFYSTTTQVVLMNLPITSSVSNVSKN